MLQTPLVELYIPIDGTELIKVYPEGNKSLTVNPAALLGPKLVT